MTELKDIIVIIQLHMDICMTYMTYDNTAWSHRAEKVTGPVLASWQSQHFDHYPRTLIEMISNQCIAVI